MTEREVKGLILVFAKKIEQQDDGSISEMKVYRYIKSKIKIVAPLIRNDLLKEGKK